MTRPVGRIVGEVVGDVSKLASQLQRDTERAMGRVDLDLTDQINDLIRDVESAFDEIGDDGEDASDRIVRSFQEVARDADRLFGQVAADADAAAEEVGEDFQAGGEVAERSFDELRRSANQDLNAIQRQAGQTTAATGGRFRAMAGIAIGALAGITAAAAAGLAATAGFGLKAAAQLEQTTIGFEALLGSGEAAAAFLKEVQQFAAETPFEFQGVADAARRFLAFGAAVGISRKEVLPTIETVGSLVSVLGGGQFEIDAVTRAFGQMASKGKISQEELLQLAEALPGFSANAAIAAGLGVSTGEAMERITKGEVSAREGIDFLLTGMAKFPGAAGAMAKQAETLTGTFSTFKDTISIALTDAFAPIIPEIKAALSTLTPVIGDVIKVLAPALAQLITAALPLAGVLLQAFTPVVVPILEILSKLLPTLTPPLLALGGVLGDLVAAADPLIQALGQVAAELITQGLIPALQELIPQLVEMTPALAELAIALIPLIPPLGELLAVFIRMQTPLLQLVAMFLEFATTEAVIPLVAEFTENLGKFLAILTPFSKEFGKITNWPGMLDRAGESLSKLGDIIGSALGDAWSAVVGFFAGIGEWFGRLPGLFVDLLGAAFDAGVTAVGRGIGLLLAGIIGIPRLVVGALFGLPPLIWGLFTDLWTKAAGISMRGVTNLLTFLWNMPKLAWNALSGLGRVLWNAVTGAFRRAREGAATGLQRLISLIFDAPRRLREIGPKMLSAGRHLISQFLSGLNRVGGFIGDVAGSITGAVKGLLNRVIGRLNAGIADIDAKLPFSLPRIPQLARGGLTQAEGLARLHPDELVLPLRSPSAVDLLAQAMQEAQDGLRAAGTPTVDLGGVDVRVFVGERELTDIVDVQITRRDRRTVRRVRAGAGRGGSR